MKELSEQLEEVKNDTTVIGDNPPKTRALFDLVKQGNYTAEDVVEARKNRQMATAPNYQSRKWIKFKTGFENGLHEIGKTGNNLEIWGGQGALSIGGILGSERVENFGRSLISSAYSEIEAKDKKYAQKAIPLSEDEYEDFSTALGAGLANYGGMLGLGYLTGGVGSVAGLSTKAAGALTETAGLGSMFAMELGGKAQDKINTYIEKSGDVDLKDYTADIASKDFMFSAMYASGSMIMEKKFGFGEQRKLFKMPFGQRLKNVAKTAVSEGGTELSQGLYEIGVDVAGGYLDFSKLPEKFMQAVQAGAVGGVLGGGAGVAAAIGHRSQAKAILREQLQNTVPEKDLDSVVDAIYEEADATARSVIAQELVQSEELRNKHGAIYEQIKDVINKQITDAGAYSDVEEAKKAQYIEGEASRFADEVLAEANKRGVTIDDVLTPNDIVYKDGRIYLQGLTEEQQKVRERKRRKKSREEVKPQEDELKAQIEENAPAEEKEQNLNDVVSSYEGAENYDVESMSTDEKQAVFEAEEAVKDSFTAPEENYDDIVRRLRYEDLTEEQEQKLQEKLDEAGEKLKPLFDTAQDVALEIDEEFGLTLGDISNSISERRLNFKEAENLFGDYFPVNDLRELGEKIKERDNLRGDAVKIGYDYYTQRVYEAYDERIAREKNLSFEFPEREAKEDRQIDLSPETNEAIQEETLPEVEKEDTTTPDKIEDFGEYLYGARKDLWTGFKEKINKELPENDEDIKLSEAFPEPNYEKLIANGVDVNVLATIKAIRDIIPTKPKNTYSYRFDKWAKTVRTFRALTSKIIEGDFSLDVADTLIPESLKTQVQLYRMLGYPYFTKAKGYTLERTYYHNYSGDSFVMTNVYHEGDKEGYEIEYNGRNVSVNGSFFFENINDGIDEIKSRIDIDLAKGKSKDKTVKFDIYYNTRERGKIFLGKKIRSGKYVDLRTFGSIKEAREYLANNYDTLVEELNRLKQNPMTRGEVNEARVGEDYRKGANATPEMFADTFGFRGVQFGNWVEQKKRISDLNEAYDALIDLSKILGVPTRAIALNGTLGLAFGARGRGGFGDVAAAHYEPDTVVINLTKKYGAGSLAHEWFHALDNSFMKKDDKQLGYTSELANENNPLSHNRPEVMLAFFNLRNILEKSKLFERSKEWDKAKTDDYWSTIREMGARTFEQYIKDKLKEKDVSNDFLVNLLSIDSEHNVYLNKDEKAEIYAAYDKLFNTLKTRETEKGVEFYQESSDIAESENIYHQESMPSGIDLTITKEQQNKAIDLENERLEKNVGANQQDENFDYWVEEYFKKQEEERIDKMGLGDAEDLFGTLEEVNEEITDDPEYNQYDRSTPFTEQEFIDYAKEANRSGVDDYVRETINSLTSQDWDNLRDEYTGGYNVRSNFFDDYQNLIAEIMEDNGFYVSRDESRVSDSRYIDVYKSEEDSDNGEEPFSKIRISDHDTYKFYGNHINIYTDRNVIGEINKLKASFARGDLGVDETVYYQSAFAGSRVDYDRPSLEAIGSGEGHAAHGWGLYYALSKDVAEKYRKTFSRQSGYKYNGKELKYIQFGKYNAASGKRRALQDIIVKSTGQEAGEEFADIVKELKDKYKQTIEDSRDYDSDFWQRERKIAEENLKGIEQIDFSKLEKVNKGQLHEVDIPENPYLLDEQKMLGEQSQLVKKALREVAKQVGVKWDNRYDNGKYIYDNIANVLGSQKSASQMLEKYGIKGITYDGRRDGRCFVIFNPEDVRVIQKFYQGERVKRGSFDALTKSIKITDKADFSTYAHEFAHYWLDNMWNYANSEMASQNYKDQFNEVKKWLGVKADQTYLTSAQHEKFARGYEKYLYTGNIPNPIIGDVFKDYNEFIKEVYESLEEVDTRAGKKYEPITPVMKEFFDSMITGKIEETEKPTEEAQEKPTTETKEVKPRGLAKTTAEMAEQKGIEVEKPTYEVRKQTKMAEKADEFIKENKQLAIDIVKGLAPEQDGIFREDLFAALRELALNEGDSDLLNDLSRSMTVEEATELGQRIQALARGRINPVKEMTELREERMKKNKVTKEKIKDETKKATKEIENEIALAAEPKEWQEFVKSLEC